MTLQAHRLGASAALRWFGNGFALFRRQPIAMMSVALAMMVVSNLAMAIPLPGIPIYLVLLPGLSCASMYACRSIEQGKFARPTLLIAAFREPSPRGLAQVQLGLLFVLALFIAMVPGSLLISFDRDAAAELLQRMRTEPEVLGQMPQGFWLYVLVQSIAWLAVVIAFWFAPVLVAWQELGVRKALFFSVVAAGRCLPALLCFVVLSIVVLGALSFVAGLLFQALSIADSAGTLLLIPIAAAASAVLMCAAYWSYRDAFDVAPAD